MLREWILLEAEVSVVADETVNGISQDSNATSKVCTKSFLGTSQNEQHVSQSTVSTSRCSVCRRSHNIEMCEQAQLLSYNHRWDFA